MMTTTTKIRNYALPGLLALALLAACSGKQEPAAGPATADDEKEAATTAAPPAAQPAKDYAKMALGMMSLLAEAPECQSYRDELQAIADAPAGTKPAREPSLIVAAAHDAGCSKKARGE